MAADGAACASQVARFPGFFQSDEGLGNVLRELTTGGGVDGIGALGKYPSTALPLLYRPLPSNASET